jgi:hypothetical protein
MNASIIPIPSKINTTQNVNQDAESLLSRQSCHQVRGRFVDRWRDKTAILLFRTGTSLLRS